MIRDARLPLAAAMLSMAATPALAADDTTTGILAGIGITAATGKTSLANGAGAIEATLLSADLVQLAGTIIAAVAGQASPGKVLVLARDEKLNFVPADAVTARINQVTAQLEASCPVSTKGMQAMLPKNAKLMASDIVGVGLTETAVSGLTITADDRVLVNAVAAGGTVFEPVEIDGRWHDGGKETGAALNPDFVLPSTLIGVPAKTKVGESYAKLIDTIADRRPHCAAAAAAPLNGPEAIKAADALVTYLNTVAGDTTPLANAKQMEQLGADTSSVLRVAVEQAGGTSIARTGIAYSFGWPDAATVGAGLLVSFRLSDPRGGILKATGHVRCLTRQTNVKKVIYKLATWPAASERDGKPNLVCAYRAWGVPAALQATKSKP